MCVRAILGHARDFCSVLQRQTSEDDYHYDDYLRKAIYTGLRVAKNRSILLFVCAVDAKKREAVTPLCKAVWRLCSLTTSVSCRLTYATPSILMSLASPMACWSFQWAVAPSRGPYRSQRCGCFFFLFLFDQILIAGLLLVEWHTHSQRGWSCENIARVCPGHLCAKQLCLVRSGDAFYIPPGRAYSLHNNSTTHIAKAYFACPQPLQYFPTEQATAPTAPPVSVDMLIARQVPQKAMEAIDQGVCFFVFFCWGEGLVWLWSQSFPCCLDRFRT